MTDLYLIELAATKAAARLRETLAGWEAATALEAFVTELRKLSKEHNPPSIIPHKE